jgi:hypothetical protein
MGCRVFDQEDVIPKYLSGRLDLATEDEFGMHLLECSDCQNAVETLQLVRQNLIAREHEIRSYSTARRRLWWPQLALAASLLLVFGIGFSQWARHRRGSTQPVQQASSKSTKPEATLASGSPNATREPANHQPQSASSPPGISAHNAQNQAPSSVEKGASDHLAVNSSAHTSGETAPAPTTEVAGLPASEATPPKTSTETPSNLASPATPETDELAKLAVVRALPYSFAGVAASQPSGGGSTKGFQVPSAGLSARSANSKPGTSGFHTAQDYFTAGMYAYVDRNYETAADLLGEAVQLNPNLPEANLYFGICKLLLGKPQDAVSPLQSASRGDKPAVSQAGHFYLAKSYLKLRKRAEAEDELRASAAIPGRLSAESNALIERLRSIPVSTPSNK